MALPEKGFAKNRSIVVDNTIELEGALYEISLGVRDADGLLLDVQTGFPSIGHEWVWAVLERIAIPLPSFRLIKAVYRLLIAQLPLDGEIVGEHTANQRDKTGLPLVSYSFRFAPRPIDQSLLGNSHAGLVEHLCTRR